MSVSASDQDISLCEENEGDKQGDVAESETKLAAVKEKMKQVGVVELEQIYERESKQSAVTGHRMAGVAGAK